MGRLANKVIVVITTVVTVVTFVGFLVSKPVNEWTKTHSEVIFYGFIVCFLAAGIALNYFFEERKKYQKLKRSTSRVKPSGLDKKLFQSFMGMLPPDGPVIAWLKVTSEPEAFKRKDYAAMEDVLRKMKLQSLRFDNSKVRAGYDQLHAAMQKFNEITLRHMRSNPPWLEIPPELDSDTKKAAKAEISQIRLELTEEYDSFLDLAHQNGID